MIKININKIKNNVIKKGFSELSDEDIQIEWNNIKDSCFVLVPFKSEGYCIEIDNSMRKASVMVIEGGLAHEFAHIILNHKVSDEKSEREADELVKNWGFDEP